MKLYKTKFGSIQKLVYESYRKSMKGDTKISPMERRTANQISNMVYPVSGLIKGGIQKDKIIPKEISTPGERFACIFNVSRRPGSVFHVFSTFFCNQGQFFIYFGRL